MEVSVEQPKPLGRSRAKIGGTTPAAEAPLRPAFRESEGRGERDRLTWENCAPAPVRQRQSQNASGARVTTLARRLLATEWARARSGVSLLDIASSVRMRGR